MDAALSYDYKQLGDSDVPILRQLLGVFAMAFDDYASYQGAVPVDAYLGNLLAKDHFIALAVLDGDDVVGGLTAYVLDKFEQDRREVYIYDLAVLETHRRKRIAKTLIASLTSIARERDAYGVIVLAEHGDTPAIRLYESLGTRQDVHLFEIKV
jgi:ribosomal protein S18 acetylase RimI-like enzyme